MHVCAEPLADIRCSVDFIINLQPSCIGEWLGCLAVDKQTLHNQSLDGDIMVCGFPLQLIVRNAVTGP